MIKVIYSIKSSRMVEEHLLDDLIVRGEIVAFCRSDGWVDVRNDVLHVHSITFVGLRRPLSQT